MISISTAYTSGCKCLQLGRHRTHTRHRLTPPKHPCQLWAFRRFTFSLLLLHVHMCVWVRVCVCVCVCMRVAACDVPFRMPGLGSLLCVTTTIYFFAIPDELKSAKGKVGAWGPPTGEFDWCEYVLAHRKGDRRHSVERAPAPSFFDAFLAAARSAGVCPLIHGNPGRAGVSCGVALPCSQLQGHPGVQNPPAQVQWPSDCTHAWFADTHLTAIPLHPDPVLGTHGALALLTVANARRGAKVQPSAIRVGGGAMEYIHQPALLRHGTSSECPLPCLFRASAPG